MSIEHKILGALLFPEKLEMLFDEIKEDQNVIQDVLKQLIRDGLVATVKNTESQISPTEIYYDSDHMNSYAYVITSKGIEALENKK